jgi:alpha-1,2-mannosyltransferase
VWGAFPNYRALVHPQMAVGEILIDGGRAQLGRWVWSFAARRAWYAWLIFGCVVGAVVARAPDYRTVTPNYRDACHNWFAGQPIYAEGVHGFLYFPHAAILFAPFTYLPPPFGDVLWRVVSIGALAVAAWRLARLLNPATEPWAAFALITCLTIPPALASARNGQMNLMLTALTTFAFVELSRKHWRAGAYWLCLGAAFKPLMIVPIAVAAVVYRPVLRPLVSGWVALLAAPLLTQHTTYVWEQYQICVQKLFLAGNPGSENPASDLFGLFSSLGLTLPLVVQTPTRAVVGVATVILAVVAVRRHDPARAAISVLALTACYLALFNPRMENNSYVVLAPTMGVLAADALLYRRRALAGWLMIGASLGIAGSYEITRGYNFWLCPLLATVVWAYVIFDVGVIPSRKFLFGGASTDIAS